MSQVLKYDESDPANPFQNTAGGATAFLLGRAQDLAGEETFPGTSGGLLAVATGAGPLPLPSNIFFYDVSNPDNLKRIGAMSVTGSASQEGTILHMIMKGPFAYTTTFQKGIQVVDVQQAINEYNQVFSTNPVQFGTQITTEGEGFARDTVVNTIPVMTTAFGPTPVNATLYGLAAADFTLDQQTQTIVAASGVESLAVVDPLGGQVLAQSTHLVAPNGTMQRGFSIALGTIGVPCPSGAAFNVTSCNVAAVGGFDPGGKPILVVVDLTNPRNPVPIGAVILDSTALDIVMQDNLALVGEGINTQITDLSDPSRPTPAGTITGIGGRLTVNGFLFGTAGGGVNGLHVAALGALAYVKSFEPKTNVISAGNQLFSNVRINYAIIPPDPQIQTAEVHIDVEGGSRAATLPGSVSAGKGTVIWPSGTTINTSQNYLATVHAQANGGELPTIAKRVPLMKVPIAIAPRDKMLRIQFALPDQGFFTDSAGNPIDKYSVKIYLNADGSGSPAFTVASKDIANAYPNTDVWFNVNADGTGGDIPDGSAQATQPWVARKIDKIINGDGLIFPIKVQAYEVGTVLADYSSVYVAVVSEKTGDLVSKLTATTSIDNNWAQVVQRVASKVDQVPTPTSSGGMLSNSSMIYRVLLAILQAVGNYAFEVLHGLLDGFIDGLEGDAQMIGSVFDAVFHPVKTARAIKEFFGKLIQTLNQISFSSLFKSLYGAAGSFLRWPTLDETVLLAGKAGYFFGYLGGVILELVLSTFLIGFISGGVGAHASKALAALRAFDWIANLLDKAVVVLRFLGYWLERLAKLATDNALTKAAFGFLRE